MRALFEGAEVTFYTEVDADPEMATTFVELLEESKRRVEASAEEADAILRRYEEAGKPFGLFLRTFEREAHRYHLSAQDQDK